MWIKLEREIDGRWIAEVPAIPGVIVYGSSPEHALKAARRLAADVIEDRRMLAEPVPDVDFDAAVLTMVVGRRAATVVRNEINGMLVGYVDGLRGAHTQAASLDELFLNFSEVIELVTENGSAPDNLPEERLSPREN